jgi:hypothetical protein
MTWLLNLFPGRIVFYLVFAGAVFAAGGTAAWQVQQWRFDSKEKERVEQILADERTAAKTQLRRTEQVVAAQSAAATRETGLRRDADNARLGLNGLLDATTGALQTGRSSLDACVAGAATASQLLNQCGAAYQELGERCDRHVSDIKTLMESWPK